MTNIGTVQIGPIPKDEPSRLGQILVEDYVRAYPNKNKVFTNYTQLATDASVEFSQKGGLTIADIGKSPLTMVAATSADDESYRGKVVTLNYKKIDGTAGTSTATLNAENSTTEVAFSPAIADFYCATDISWTGTLTSTHLLQVGVTTVLTSAVLLVDGSKILAGVGTVFIGEEADTAADYNLVCYFDYCTPWGEVKYAQGTLDGADSTTLAYCYVIENGTVTTTIVNNFYRLRRFWTTKAAGKYIALSNNTPDTYYAVIEEAYDKSIHSRYFVPKNQTLDDSRVYLAYGCGSYPQTKDKSLTLYIVCTPYGDAVATTIECHFSGGMTQPQHMNIRLEPCTDVTFSILGVTGAVGRFSMNIVFFEVW